MDWITLRDACDLLKVSRPTLNSYRRRHNLSELRRGRSVYLSRGEILERIILPAGTLSKTDSLTLLDSTELIRLQPIPGVYDLRTIKAIDTHGVMALLCSIKAYLKTDPQNSVHLLLDDSPMCSYLSSIGFIAEVERNNPERVYCNKAALKSHSHRRSAIILPLHRVGYRGAEKKILDELYDPLLKQGFSEAYCSYIGWIIGELCDNAHTHSEGPCYLIIEGLESSSTSTRFLSISVGDIGIGIPASLRKNSNYKSHTDQELLPLAFQSGVSSMEVIPKRGKGLNDVLAISKGNSSWFRVESGGLGMLFDFRNGADRISFMAPMSQATGTRFCLVLIDNAINQVGRAEVDSILETFRGAK